MTKNTLTVISRFQIVGFHHWPNAPEEYAYLGKTHRHIFHFEVECNVKETNREIEFIDLGDNIKDDIRSNYPPAPFLLDSVEFGGRSCEMIAEEVLDILKANHYYKDINFKTITVLEDGENGSRIYC